MTDKEKEVVRYELDKFFTDNPESIENGLKRGDLIRFPHPVDGNVMMFYVGFGKTKWRNKPYIDAGRGYDIGLDPDAVLAGASHPPRVILPKSVERILLEDISSGHRD